MTEFELGQYVQEYSTIARVHGEESAVAYVERELTEAELQRFWKIVDEQEAKKKEGRWRYS